MKKIEKKEPVFYSEYIKRNSPREWKAIDSAMRSQMRKHILDKEQSSQCAYTELGLSSTNSHIDHFKKQADSPQDRFVWNNLLVSCNSENYGAKYKDKNVKREDYDLMLNPSISNPSNYLYFALTGRVHPQSTSSKGEKTISLLNLNHKSLINQRSVIAMQVKALVDQLSLSEMKKAIGEFDTFVETIYKSLKEYNNG